MNTASGEFNINGLALSLVTAQAFRQGNASKER